MKILFNMYNWGKRMRPILRKNSYIRSPSEISNTFEKWNIWDLYNSVRILILKNMK